jgi:hypothetical protein
MQIWPTLSCSSLACLGLGLFTPAFAQTPPDYYVGAGVRFGFNDDTAFVVDSKAKLVDLGDFTLSTRPSVLFGGDVELRLPVSVEAPISDGIFPYGGAGVAYNTDGNSRFDAMLTGGVDVDLGRNLVLDVGLNVVFKPGNTDTELATTLNYSF